MPVVKVDNISRGDPKGRLSDYLLSAQSCIAGGGGGGGLQSISALCRRHGI